MYIKYTNAFYKFAVYSITYYIKTIATIYHNVDCFKILHIMISWRKYNKNKKNLVVYFFLSNFARYL